MKKIVTTIGTIIVTAIVSTGLVLAVQSSFPDINSGDWYYNAVNNLASWGIVHGYDDGKFKPNNNVNRAELAIILNKYDDRLNYRLMGMNKALFKSFTADFKREMQKENPECSIARDFYNAAGDFLTFYDWYNTELEDDERGNDSTYQATVDRLFESDEYEKFLEQCPDIPA